tara:strand:- start:17454 stop:17693 length:240 start_codon:yes stop_codon:yes gene_type:complete
MTTKVVHINTNLHTRYIGRPSIYGNPFAIGRDGTREEVILKYKEYFYKKIQQDEILGCYCAPKACHGNIIADWLDNASA